MSKELNKETINHCIDLVKTFNDSDKKYKPSQLLVPIEIAVSDVCRVLKAKGKKLYIEKIIGTLVHYRLK